MENKETLYRVYFHNKKNGYRTFLHVWAEDAMSAIESLHCVVGLHAEYALESVIAMTDNGAPIEREKP